MKGFITKVVLLSAIPILYFGINMLVNHHFYSDQTVSLPDKNILIAGDSHTQKSLNPSYFSSAQNISQPAEPYVLTYWKLKKIFQSYVPDTLILGFAPHNISAFNDLKFSDDRWAAEMFRRSYTIEAFEDISDMMEIDMTRYYKVLWKETAFYPKKNHINYIGHYSNRQSSNVSDWESAVSRHYFDEDEKPLGLSVAAIHYLDSIAHLCNHHDVKLLLISNPLFPKYRNGIPDDVFERYDDLIKKLGKDHLVYDRTRDNYPKKLLLDADHLNEQGAKRFAKELQDYLKNL